MFKPGFIVLCLLLALAGCSTGRRAGTVPPVPDGNAPAAEVERVFEPPALAPPAGALPEQFHPLPPPRAETWIALDRWARENEAGTLRRVAWTPAPVYSLNTARGVFTFQIKSLAAKWNGTEFFLGFEPQLISGQPYLHVIDLEKNLIPLLGEEPLPAATNLFVVIDPGHGGKDYGTQSIFSGGREKDYTLDWARRLARLLTAGGAQVLLTRTEDSEHSLSNRVAFAEAQNADLFIALHFNSSAPDHEQSGLETYCLTPAGMPSTLTRGYDDVTSQVFPNNAFDEDNFLLAIKLHQALLQAAGMADRGVRRARFLGVLRGQNRPAVLIEGGYLSNPREARRIADPDYREKLAGAIASVLLE